MGYSAESSRVTSFITCITRQNYLVVQSRFIPWHPSGPDISLLLWWGRGCEMLLWMVWRAAPQVASAPGAKCLLLFREECLEKAAAFIQPDAVTKCLCQSFF